MNPKKPKANELILKLLPQITKVALLLLAFVVPITLFGQNGLIAHYPFNGNANDESGNGNDGTVVGAALTTDRFENENSAYEFKGDDYINLGDGSSTILNSNFTINAWIYPTVEIINNTIGGEIKNEGGTIINREGEYEIAIFTNRTIQFAVANTNPGWHWTNTGITCELNKWSCITMTFNNGEINFYLNGTLQYTYNGSGALNDDTRPNENDLRIGGRQATPQFFWGKIDDVRIYNRVLSNNEINELYQNNKLTNIKNEEGLTAFWKFDESSGTTFYNSATEINDGTTVTDYNFPTFTAGKINNGLFFNFSNQEGCKVIEGTTSSNPYISTGEEFSLGGWINISSATGNYLPIFDLQSSASSVSNRNAGIGLSFTDELKIDVFKGTGVYNSSRHFTSTLTFPTEQWVHLVVTHSGSTAKFYIDGALVETGELNGGEVNWNGNAYHDSNNNIGVSYRNGNTIPYSSFDGYLDELFIYDREITSDEVNAIFKNGWTGNNEVAEHLYPVFKYHLIQDGTRGIKVGMTMLSLFNIASSQTIIEAFEEALLMGLEHTRDILLDDLVPSAKYITGCVKYKNDNSAVTNADIEYILETKNEIKIGIPFNAELKRFESDMGSKSDLIPPKVSTIINDSYIKDEPIPDFKTVYEAGYKMSASLGQNFSFSTIGVVNDYIHSNGKNFLLLHNFDIANVFDSDGINFKYIPVDISTINELPKKGSLVKLKGNTQNLDFVIKQEYAYYGREKVYQYVNPTEFEIIKGEATSSPVYNSPVFYQFINDSEDFEWGKPVSNITSIVAISLGSEKINAPDFCFKENVVEILPQGFIRSGNSYTIKATLQNKGNIEGDCVVRAFAEIANNRVEINNTVINSFKPGEEKDIIFNWLPSKPDEILLTPSKVYFTISKTSPFENETTNNSSFKEFHFLKDVDYKTFFIVTSYCPVTLKVTSPEGQIIDIENNAINDAEYIVDDFDGNGSIDNRIVLPDLVQGTYKIEVLPKENAKSDDTYTLKIVTNNEESTLADSVKITEIPINHYTHVYTSNKVLERDTKIKIWSQNEELIIKCNDIKSSEILVEIIDISGRTIYSNNHEIINNNPIKINASSIKGTNIVRISNQTINESTLIIRPE